MLHFFEKNNQEGPDSRRGILTLKYYKIWRGESSISKFIAMRQQFEEEMTEICQNEVDGAHRSCQEAKNYLKDLFGQPEQLEYYSISL